MENIKNTIHIMNPCNIKWSSLEGKGCSRFCPSCSRSVTDLTGKSTAQIVDLVMRQNRIQSPSQKNNTTKANCHFKEGVHFAVPWHGSWE